MIEGSTVTLRVPPCADASARPLRGVGFLVGERLGYVTSEVASPLNIATSARKGAETSETAKQPAMAVRTFRNARKGRRSACRAPRQRLD